MNAMRTFQWYFLLTIIVEFNGIGMIFFLELDQAFPFLAINLVSIKASSISLIVGGSNTLPAVLFFLNCYDSILCNNIAR